MKNWARMVLFSILFIGMFASLAFAEAGTATPGTDDKSSPQLFDSTPTATPEIDKAIDTATPRIASAPTARPGVRRAVAIGQEIREGAREVAQERREGAREIAREVRQGDIKGAKQERREMRRETAAAAKPILAKKLGCAATGQEKCFQKVQEQRLEKLKEAREAIREKQEEIKEIKDKYKDLRLLNAADKVRFRAAVLNRLRNEFNQRIRALDALEVRAQSNETLALIEEMRTYLNQAAEKFKATNSTEEKKTIVKEANEKWNEFKKKIAKQMIGDKIAEAADKASTALAKMDEVIAKMKEKGFNTTRLEELSDKISEKIDAVTASNLTLRQQRWRLAHLHRWFAALKVAIRHVLNGQEVKIPEDKPEPSAQELEDHPEQVEQEEGQATPTPEASPTAEATETPSPTPESTPTPTPEPTATP